MNVYDDIDLYVTEMPPGIDDVEIMLMAITGGITLFPLIRVEGRAAARDFLVKLAATLVHGIELMDAEIEAEAAQEAEDE